jgi:hypothetical protein
MRFSRTIAAACSAVLIASIPAVGAVKAGANCKKLGQTRISQGKTFLCVKSGKQLVWSKAKSVNPIVVPSPSPSLTSAPAPDSSPLPTPTLRPTESKSPNIDLPSDPRISGTAAFDPVENCRITQEIREDNSVAFPRPQTSTKSRNPRVLVLPVSFTDVPYTETDLNALKLATKGSSQFFYRQSYGLSQIEFIFAEKDNWVSLSKSTQEYGVREFKKPFYHSDLVQEIINKIPPTLQISNYETVLIETGRYGPRFNGNAFPKGFFKTASGSSPPVIFQIGLATASMTVISHELGHSIFGLVDLYKLNPDEFPAGDWDLMSKNSLNLLGWHRYLNGWIADEQIRCLSNSKNQPIVVYLSEVNTDSGVKFVALEIESNKLLLVEFINTDWCKPRCSESGVLLYTVDANLFHGQGPVSSATDLLFEKQKALGKNYSVEVLKQDTNGALVSFTFAGIVKP